MDEELIVQAYMEYYYLTETFDRTFPHTTDRNGDAVVHPHYKGMSKSFAMKVSRKLREAVPEGNHRLRFRHVGTPYEELTRLYEELPEEERLLITEE